MVMNFFFVLFFLVCLLREMRCCQPPSPFSQPTNWPKSLNAAPVHFSESQQPLQEVDTQVDETSRDLNTNLVSFNEPAKRYKYPADSVFQTTPFPGFVRPPDDVPSAFVQESVTSATRSSVRQASMSAEEAEYAQGHCDPREATSMYSLLECITLLSPPQADDHALNCSLDEGSTCRFVPSEGWRAGVFAAPSESWLSSFLRLSRRPSLNIPRDGFIFVSSLDRQAEEQQISLSTKIACQQGNGMLQFDYWLVGFEQLDIRVCTEDAYAKSCTQSIVYNGSTVVVEVVLPQPPFTVSLQLSNMIFPGVLILDNLNYTADLCEETATSPLPNDSRKAFGNRLVSVPTDAPNDEEDKFFGEDLKTPHGDLVPSMKVTRRFPLASSPRPPPHEGGFSASRNESPLSVEVSRAEGKEERGPPAASPFNEGRPLETHRVSPCEVLNCDFAEDTCRWKSGGERFGAWKLGKQRIGNAHTGIRVNKHDNEDNSGFAYVGTDSRLARPHRGQPFILESTLFSLDRPVQLSFDLYRRSNDISFQVCLNDLSNCPYKAPPVEKDVFWKEGETVTLPLNTKKVFFVATQYKKFKWLAVDNIRVDGGLPCTSLGRII